MTTDEVSIISKQEILTSSEIDELTAHLHREYAGVFEQDSINAHIEGHAGIDFAGYAVQVIQPSIPAGARILDVGSGFGSFVMAARHQGPYDAIGTEIAPYEVNFARRRLERMRPQDDPQRIYLGGGIFDPGLEGMTFDAITFWNVIEHIDDYKQVLAKAVELLAPGGTIFILCPNYFAWRPEAHYHIPWHPFLTREAAVKRLRHHGKDPAFFESSIFLRTNWDVIKTLRGMDLDIYDRLNQMKMSSAASILRHAIRRPKVLADFYNPARFAVELAARKKTR